MREETWKDDNTDTQYEITKAIQQAKQSAPNKESMLDHLTKAKSLIKGATAARET
ncbi:hypothetical protein KDK_13570 [Dictyobacter kobayashii]|uniref:Uncharacterized protein n=1 Tax=Dictyobacter kobayashii TaxID=2014872 RepID=A0A402AEK8_9CHLR|nr:hypothetical protein KDK_13570 [Dictyobacter kobayashii]